MANRYFADESDNNSPTFNAAEYKKSGSRTYATKATQGLTGTQPPYVERVTAAHKAGLKVIHYHFAEPALGDPAGQIKFFLETVAPHFKRGDHLVLDVEWPAATVVETINWTKVAFAYLYLHGHKGAPLYTDLAFFLENGDKELVPPSGNVWAADYGAPGDTVESLWDKVKAALPKNAFLWALQLSDGVHGPAPHRIPGIGENSDISILAPAFSRLRHKIKK
jgi:GH25 family lysozyme M1 (1,4-beta-N-acetylmuramidase)